MPYDASKIEHFFNVALFGIMKLSNHITEPLGIQRGFKIN